MFDRFDILSAYWLFACHYHGGQFTKTYAILGRCEKAGFRPGLLFSFDSLTSNGKDIYEALVTKHESSLKGAA